MSIYCAVADLTRLISVDRDAVYAAARLMNHRIIGDFIWFRTTVSPAFVEEAQAVFAMNERARNRRLQREKTAHSNQKSAKRCDFLEAK